MVIFFSRIESDGFLEPFFRNNFFSRVETNYFFDPLFYKRCFFLAWFSQTILNSVFLSHSFFSSMIVFALFYRWQKPYFSCAFFSFFSRVFPFFWHFFSRVFLLVFLDRFCFFFALFFKPFVYLHIFNFFDGHLLVVRLD